MPVALTVDVEGGRLPADLYLPPSGRGPGMVLFQEIFGVTDYLRSRATDLAALGYAVLVPHLYWRQGSPVVSEGADGLPRAMALLGELDWDLAVQDGAAAVAALRARPEVDAEVGALGFCFGGGLAFAVCAAARATPGSPDVLVSYYGSALPQLLGQAPDVTCPSLHHFGRADSYIVMDRVREIEAAVTAGGGDVTFCTYEGAGHAFDNPSPIFHDEAASREAWATTSSWLADRLPLGP